MTQTLMQHWKRWKRTRPFSTREPLRPPLIDHKVRMKGEAMTFDAFVGFDTEVLDTDFSEPPAANPGAPSEWTEDFVLRVLCAPYRVRASWQEAQALRNFARSQRP